MDDDRFIARPVADDGRDDASARHRPSPPVIAPLPFGVAVVIVVAIPLRSVSRVRSTWEATMKNHTTATRVGTPLTPTPRIVRDRQGLLDALAVIDSEGWEGPTATALLEYVRTEIVRPLAIDLGAEQPPHRPRPPAGRRPG
jgi:hypothetical protein